MNLGKYKILPIEDIIASYKEFSKIHTKIVTVIITDGFRKYHFPFKPTLQLRFFDVDKKHPMFIQETDVQKIKSILLDVQNASLVIVGCDAGISRSPAVAMAISYMLGDNSYVNIAYHYRYYNSDVFDFIVEKLK